MITEGRSYEAKHEDLSALLNTISDAALARRAQDEAFVRVGQIVNRILSQPIDPNNDNPDDGDDGTIDPPVTSAYPEPHMKNVVRPGDLGSWNGGTWSFRPTDTVGYTIRSRGGQTTDPDNYVTFIGWDFSGEGRDKAWAALDLPDDTRIDFIDCKFRDARQSVAIEGQYNDGRNFHVRFFSCKWRDNYRDPRSGHSAATFISPTPGSVDSTCGFYNCEFINSGTGPTQDIRDRVATWFDHANYVNQNGRRVEFIGCVGLNYASQFAKGPWQEVYLENCVMANGAFGGFFGADGGEQSHTGERITRGGLKDVLIYAQTDLVAQQAPHSFGWNFQACDVSIDNVIVANPNPRLNHTPAAFWLTSQGDRPIVVSGSNNRVFGYTKQFASRGQYGHTKLGAEVTTWTADVQWNENRLPDVDLNELIAELDAGNIQADQALPWFKNKLGL